MSDKSKRMTDDQLNGYLDNELRQTIGFHASGDEITKERVRNLEYYLNLPLGDEVDGRSKLQSSDVQDVVEALLPDLLAPFISSDDVVEFKPVGKEDEEHAEYAGAYINHVFNVDNNGVGIQYTWIKDAILQKNGFVFADWTVLEKTRRSKQVVDYNGYLELMDDPEIEVLEVVGYEFVDDQTQIPVEPDLLEQGQFDPENIMFEVDHRRRWKEGRVKIRNIPPEYMLVSSTATCVEDARLIGWMEEVTLSDLREEGYDEEKLEGLSFSNGDEQDITGERDVRERAQGGYFDDAHGASDSTDPSGRKLWRTIVWTRVDVDGDGKTELRKIVRAGGRHTGGKILLSEEADDVPIVSFTPIPMPHQLFGRCPADQTISVQDGKTAMLRASMDGTYSAIEPRYGYVEELASDDTWDDLMLGIPGAPIRMSQIGAIQQIADAPDLSSAYQMLEYFDRIREIRTPVTRQDQGVDPDVLRDKTASEARIQANASARRKELILRLYAESLGKLFQHIHRIVIKNQDRPRQVRLMGDFIDVDPRYWNADMDVSVSVGLGTGTKEQQLQGLMMVLAEQKDALAAGLPLVNPENIYNTYSRLVEYQGLSTPELYFTDPAKQEQQQPQMPSPEQQKAEAEKVEQAIQQAREAGKQEGMDQVKLLEMQSKERMHSKDFAVDQAKVAIDAQEADIKARDSMLDHMRDRNVY